MKIKRLLSLIFFFSGFSSLIYQVVWQRLMTVYYGVGSISICLIVSIFMAGLGFGSLLGGYLSERVENKIRLYFIIELLIGCFGLGSLPFLNFLGQHTAGSNYLVAFGWMSVFLLLPTMLMGLTFPLLTKIFNRLIRDFSRTVSFLYFINTIGAAIGTVFASYVLISFIGLDGAVYTAAAVNLILAFLIFSCRHGYEAEEHGEEVISGVNTASMGKIVYLLVFITGFLAIGYEIVWFRILGVIIKESPYAFSSMLFVYLLAIAMGSSCMGKLLKKRELSGGKDLYFSLQVLIAVSVTVIICGYYYLTLHTPFGALTELSFNVNPHPLTVVLEFRSEYLFMDWVRNIYIIADVFLWPFLFVFIPAYLMGASFPLISSLALKSNDSEGKTIGTVYFFNIAGNVFGGIITGFMLLPVIGTERTLLVFVIIGMLFALKISRMFNKPISILKRCAVLVLTITAILIVFPQKMDLYKTIHTKHPENFTPLFEEGINGVIATFVDGERVGNYINGVAHGGRPGYRFYAETIEALGYTKSLDNVLIIGYGTGSTMETILRQDHVKKITLVELNKTLIKNLRKIDYLDKMLNDGRVNLILDDGRRHLLRTDEKYDLILIDPLKSTSAYSNNLYSRQFYEIISDHLKPEGVFLVWMNEFVVMPKTGVAVFQYARFYQEGNNGFSLFSNSPFKGSDQRAVTALSKFSKEDRQKIIDSLTGVKGDEHKIREVTKNFPINEDWKPNCEYYIGLKAKTALFYLK